jgi:hypothetical protein
MVFILAVGLSLFPPSHAREKNHDSQEFPGQVLRGLLGFIAARSKGSAQTAIASAGDHFAAAETKKRSAPKKRRHAPAPSVEKAAAMMFVHQ